MRYVVALLGTTVSIGFICVSILINFRFGQMLGATEFDGYVYAIASACADGFKVILPFCMIWAWRNTKILAAFVSLCLFILFSTYSMTSSLGYSATNRSVTTGVHAKQAANYNALQETYAKLLSDRNALSKFRPINTLQALIHAKIQNFRWLTTDRCLDATVELSRIFCAEYFNLTAELEKAKQAQHLYSKLEHIQKQLYTIQGRAAITGNIDPQVKFLKIIFGIPKEKIELGLTVILSLLVETGSALGLFVTFGHEKNHNLKRKTSQIDKILASKPLFIEPPSLQNKEWFSQCLLRDASSWTSLHELYHNYSEYSQESQSDTRMTLTDFRKWLHEIGLCNTKRKQGHIFFFGVKFKRDCKMAILND
ncbi:MAG: hypothetical protein AAF228_06960 [Pseudomonadota bacterium]